MCLDFYSEQETKRTKSKKTAPQQRNNGGGVCGQGAESVGRGQSLLTMGGVCRQGAGSVGKGRGLWAESVDRGRGQWAGLQALTVAARFVEQSLEVRG